MARDLNGVNEHLDFGSDASVDDYTAFTIALWVVIDSAAAVAQLLAKDAFSAAWQSVTIGAGSPLAINRAWTLVTNVFWQGTTDIVGTGMRHVVFSYDGAAAANDAAIYIDGVAEAITEINGPPAGALVSDAAQALLFGENAAGGDDLDGRVQNLAFDDKVWTAAERNRARWWGRPVGPSGLRVYHPLFTTKLANEGTATAAGTATGTTMASLPRVERCHAAMLGVGR